MATRIREKAEKRAKEKDNRPYAKVKYIRISPSKVGLVLDNIRAKKQSKHLQFLKIQLKAVRKLL